MNFEVKAIHGEPREWSSSHGGTFLSYKVDLEDQDGILERSVEWNKKDTSPAPSVGERVAGHLEDGKFGSKFKIDYEATKELPQTRSGSSEYNAKAAMKAQRTSWQPESERDPERAARILRQHSQEMALRAIASADEEPQTPADLEELIIKWADFFDEDVRKAGQGAGPAQDSSLEAAAAHPSGDSPASGQPPADVGVSLEEIDMALDGAGVTYSGARAFLSAWMVKDLAPERIVKAVRLLTGSDLTVQAKTLQDLKTMAESHTGELVPVPSDVDFDLPPASGPNF